MSDKNTPDSSFSPQGNSNSNKPAAEPNDDLVLFPLDEFTAAQKTRTPSSTPPSSFRKTTTQNTGQPAWRPQAAPPAQPRGNPTNTRNTVWPQQIPRKKRDWLGTIIGLLFFIGFIYSTCSEMFDSSDTSEETTNQSIIDYSTPDSFKYNKLLIGLEYYKVGSLLRFPQRNYVFGNLILVGLTGEKMKRYIIPANVEREYNDIGLSTDFPYVSYVEEVNPGTIDEMLAINNNLDRKVLMREYKGGAIFRVPLKALEYYEEIGVTFMYDNIENFNNNQIEVVYMPLYLYELLESGADINIELKDIPTQKFKEKRKKKKNK